MDAACSASPADVNPSPSCEEGKAGDDSSKDDKVRTKKRKHDDLDTPRPVGKHPRPQEPTLNLVDVLTILSHGVTMLSVVKELAYYNTSIVECFVNNPSDVAKAVRAICLSQRNVIYEMEHKYFQDEEVTLDCILECTHKMFDANAKELYPLIKDSRQVWRKFMKFDACIFKLRQPSLAA